MILRIILLLILFASTSSAATFYASPSGSGNGLTSDTPASLSSARTLAQAAGNGTVVYLRGGVYRLTSPLALTSSDSGILWIAYRGETPEISGAIQVTGWTLHDAGNNIWQATVPNGTVTRQLYVNGVKSIRSKINPSLLSSITKTGTNYVWPSSSLTFARPTDLEIVGMTMSWSQSRIMVSSVSVNSGTTTFTLPAAAAQWESAGATIGGATWPTHPGTIENAYEFLNSTTPGQWYLNTSTNILYYVPRAGEDMSTADVELPVASQLITASQSSTVSNVTFNGITFEYTGWNGPTTAGYFLQTQANSYADTAANSANWQSNLMPPSVLDIAGGNNIQIIKATVRHSGAMGVHFGKGTKNSGITNTTITDIASNGISVGEITGNVSTPVSNDQVSNNTISNNIINNAGNEYLGGIGVFATYTDHTVITHNEVSSLPYSGIDIGWGWDLPGYLDGYANSNEVGWNKIHDIMQSLYDGGGIYSLGLQGVNGRTSVHDNYLYNIGTVSTPLNGALLLYSDQGSQGIDYSNNVLISSGASTTLWLGTNQGVIGGNQNNTASSNYATAGLIATDTSATDAPGTCSYSGYTDQPTCIGNDEIWTPTPITHNSFSAATSLTGYDPASWALAAKNIATSSGANRLIQIKTSNVIMQ